MAIKVAKIYFCLPMLLLSASCCSGCLKKQKWEMEAYGVVIKSYESPSTLRFNAGDIISCVINGYADHILLASSTTHVIHVPGAGGTKKGETEVLEQAFLETTDGHYWECRVETTWFDRQFCEHHKTNPYAVDEILRRARKSVQNYKGNKTTYDLKKCNCEHWVTHWRYGKAYSYQLMERAPFLFLGFKAGPLCSTEQEVKEAGRNEMECKKIEYEQYKPGVHWKKVE